MVFLMISIIINFIMSGWLDKYVRHFIYGEKYTLNESRLFYMLFVFFSYLIVTIFYFLIIIFQVFYFNILFYFLFYLILFSIICFLIKIEYSFLFPAICLILMPLLFLFLSLFGMIEMIGVIKEIKLTKKTSSYMEYTKE